MRWCSLLQESVLGVALGSSHGSTCPMPMVHALQWAFAASEAAVASLPPALELEDSLLIKDEVIGSAHAAPVNGMRQAKKRRVTEQPDTPELEMNSAGVTSWHSARVTEGAPSLMKVCLQPPHHKECSAWLKVILDFTKAADFGLRRQSLLLRLDLSSSNLRTHRPGCQVGTLWDSADDSAATLSAVTQVRAAVEVCLLTAICYANAC